MAERYMVKPRFILRDYLMVGLSMTRRLLLPCVMVWLAYPCPQLYGQGVQLGSIVGQVRLARGDSPPERVMVSLQTRGVTIDNEYTDSEGRFGFHGLPGNLYHVIINDPAYRRVDMQASFNPSLSPSIVIQIVLERAAPEEEKSPTGQPAVGGNPYLTDAASYAALYPKKALQHFNQALKAARQGKLDNAIDHYRKALEIAPDFYFARNQLGVAYLNRREFSLAQEQFEEVISLNQTDAAAYLNLGNVFLLTSRYDDSLHAIEEGLQKQPDSAFGHFLLGSVYARMGKLGDAESALRDAIHYDPTLSQVHLELVNLYLRQHRRADAMRELQVFLKTFPDDPLAPKAKAVLDRLGSTSTADTETP